MRYEITEHDWLPDRIRWIQNQEREIDDRALGRWEKRVAEALAAGETIPLAAPCPSGINMRLSANKYRFVLGMDIGLLSLAKIPWLDGRRHPKGTWDFHRKIHNLSIKSSSLKIALFCGVDLCDRLLEDFRLGCIPVFISVDSNVNIDSAKFHQSTAKILDRVNTGTWNFEKAINSAINSATPGAIKSGYHSESGLMPDYIRHQWTPYDYLWQTGVVDFGSAHSMCQPWIDHLAIVASVLPTKRT